MSKFSFKNPYNKAFTDFTHQANKAQQTAIERKAGAIFMDKPHSIEYKPIYHLSQTLKVLANIVSVGTCIVALYLALTGLLNAYLAAFLSLTVATIFELLKNKVWKITAKQRLRYRKTALTGVLGLIALHLVSVGASAFGAYRVSEFLQAPNTGVIVPLVDVDSVSSQYSGQIDVLDTQIAELTKLQSSSTNRRTINSLGKQKATLIESQKTAVEAAKTQNVAITKENKEKATTAKAEDAERLKMIQYSTVGVAVFFELVYILCALFILSYLFRAFVDGQQPIEDEQQQSLDGTRNSSRNATNTGGSVPHHNSANELQKPIGFEYKNKDQKTVDNEPLEYTRICANTSCKKKFIHKVHNQKFCSTDCRIETWERKTGKKLRTR
jgi:hypothetical protein